MNEILRWRRSSYSGQSGQCVEVALGGRIGVRDSKAPEQGQLTVPPSAWLKLVGQIKQG